MLLSSGVEVEVCVALSQMVIGCFLPWSTLLVIVIYCLRTRKGPSADHDFSRTFIRLSHKSKPLYLILSFWVINFSDPGKNLSLGHQAFYRNSDPLSVTLRCLITFAKVDPLSSASPQSKRWPGSSNLG